MNVITIELFTDIVARVNNVGIPPFRPRVPNDLCPTELYSLMLHCWSENPADRPESEKVQSALKLVPGNRHGNLMDDLVCIWATWPILGPSDET